VNLVRPDLLQLVLALFSPAICCLGSKGFWAQSRDQSYCVVPAIGPALKKSSLGGTDYGHHPDSLFCLHAGVLPGAIYRFAYRSYYLSVNTVLKRRSPCEDPIAAFWPDQVLKDSVAAWLFGHGSLSHYSAAVVWQP